MISIAACFKFSCKEDSWILLENLWVPDIFSLGFSYFGSIEIDEQKLEVFLYFLHEVHL